MCGRLTMTVSETAAAEGGGEAMGGWTRFWEDTRRMLKRADLVLLCLCLALTAFGIVLIASATNYLGPEVQRRRLIIQGAAAAIGVAAYFIASNVDMEHYAEKWQLFLLFNLGFIALLIFLGEDDGTGNKSWIAIPGLTSIQPAEIVKITYTILMARQLAWFREERRMPGLWLPVLASGPYGPHVRLDLRHLRGRGQRPGVSHDLRGHGLRRGAGLVLVRRRGGGHGPGDRGPGAAGQDALLHGGAVQGHL